MLSRKNPFKKISNFYKNFQLCRKLILLIFYVFRLFNQLFEQFGNSYIKIYFLLFRNQRESVVIQYKIGNYFFDEELNFQKENIKFSLKI